MPDPKSKKTSEPELVPTSASEWGGSGSTPEASGFITELPSGNRALVRRTHDLPTLLKSGQIPNPLASIVRKMMEDGDPTLLQKETRGPVLMQLMDLLDAQACKVMLDPKVSRPIPQGMDPQNGKKETWDQYMERIEDWQPDEGTLSVFQIDMSDKMYLMSIGQGMAADLASFRSEASAALADFQAGKDVGSTPKPTRRTGAKPGAKKRGAGSRAG